MMQRVLQAGNRYADCISAFEQKCSVCDVKKGRQYVSFCVEFDDFEYFADVCTDALMAGYVSAYVDKAVCRPDVCFNGQELKLILNEVIAEADRGRVRSAVVLTACKNTYINLDGLFNFGMRDFCAELDRLCVLVSDKYIQKNEYLDFIRTLRFFASVNYGSVDVIHVVMNGNNKADLYDNNHMIYQPSVNSPDYEIAAEMLYEYDDIVSELVEASPLSVVIHKGGKYSDSELVETIVNIFDDRVIFCDGCSLCREEK
jgi:hypothetical protein